MKLSELCSEFIYECLSGSMDVDVRDVIYDSRKITEGTVFVCMVGAVTDGHKYGEKGCVGDRCRACR